MSFDMLCVISDVWNIRKGTAENSPFNNIGIVLLLQLLINAFFLKSGKQWFCSAKLYRVSVI